MAFAHNVEQKRHQLDWQAQVDKDTIVQSFREIALDEALAGLAYHANGGQG